MALLYRVVEKCFGPRRDRFLMEGGLWHEHIDSARSSAQIVARTTLAHRLFIVSSRPGYRIEVVEEIELTPLAERMALAHHAALMRHHPCRLAAESLQDDEAPLLRYPFASPPSTLR